MCFGAFLPARHVGRGFLRKRRMNELRITDCYISFKSDATTYDKVVDDFLRHCVAAGIDIFINNMAVYNEKGNEIDE